MKTLKYEEVLRNEYRDLAEARASIRRVSGKDLQPEAAALGARLSAAGRVRSETCRTTRMPLRGSFLYEFSKASGNLSADGGANRTAVGAPAHRLDEFPAGYSLAGCSPAEPASASPAGHQYALKSSCRSSDFQRTANSVLTVSAQGASAIVTRPANLTLSMVPTKSNPRSGDGHQSKVHWVLNTLALYCCCGRTRPEVLSRLSENSSMASKSEPWSDLRSSIVRSLQRPSGAPERNQGPPLSARNIP